MAKPVATFTVTRRGVCVRIRVLPTVVDVDQACRAYEGRRRQAGQFVKGFFVPAVKARYIGTITLPAAGADLAEIVPHEVTHAAIERFKQVDIADDEPLAYLIGQLTQSIRRRLAERGIES